MISWTKVTALSKPCPGCGWVHQIVLEPFNKEEFKKWAEMVKVHHLECAGVPAEKTV